MKKKTNIRTMIRKIVREEVAMAIQEVITELKQPTQQVSQPKSKKKIVEKKQFVKDSILNEVLNETAQTDKEWKTMGDGTYTTNKMNDVLNKSYGDMMNGGQDMAASMGVSSDSPAAKFLNKDYSKMFKNTDKQNG